MKRKPGPLITGPRHRATLARANANCARRAANSADAQASEEDTYRAAGAAQAGWIFLRRASQLAAEMEDNQQQTLKLRSSLLKTERELRKTERRIEDGLNDYPLHTGTILYYAAVEQTLTNLKEVQNIRTVLEGLPDAERELETALIATVEYLVVQPAIREDQEPASSRPDLAQITSDARREAETILAQCRHHWQDRQERVHSPLARAARADDREATGDVSPVLPSTLACRVGDQEEEPGHGATVCLAFTAFHHQGAIWVKAAVEPYPWDFPQERAISIALINQEAMKDILAAENQFTEEERHQLITQSERAVALAEQGLHTADTDGPSTAAAAALDAGAERGTARLIAKHLTGGHTTLQQPNASEEDTAVSAQAAEAVLNTAREQGLDGTTLRWLAYAMGQTPTAPAGAGEQLTPEQRSALLEAARNAGIPESQAEEAARMAEDQF